MKEEISSKNYVIIGGHVNWVNKMKGEFPGWKYILPSSFKAVDVGELENKDRIFFFTDHISHAAYGKFIRAARERKIPFSYLHGVNMEQIIRQIYENEELKNFSALNTTEKENLEAVRLITLRDLYSGRR